jgi:hypothetical protein
MPYRQREQTKLALMNLGRERRGPTVPSMVDWPFRAGREVFMSYSIPTPFSAYQEDPQFMDHYQELSGPAQQLIIAILLLAILAGIVILRDMMKTADASTQLKS